MRDFVQVSGRIAGIVSEISIKTMSKLAETAHEVGISSLKLRCKMDPDMQPKLQSSIDRELKQYETDSALSRGFITEVGDGFALCLEA